MQTCEQDRRAAATTLVGCFKHSYTIGSVNNRCTWGEQVSHTQVGTHPICLLLLDTALDSSEPVGPHQAPQLLIVWLKRHLTQSKQVLNTNSSMNVIPQRLFWPTHLHTFSKSTIKTLYAEACTVLCTTAMTTQQIQTAEAALLDNTYTPNTCSCQHLCQSETLTHKE